MTLLALVGADTHGVTAGLAWLVRSVAAKNVSPLAGAFNVMLVVTPDNHSRLLTALPDALGTQRPAHWPETLCDGFHPLRLGNLHLVLCIGQADVVLPQCVCQANRVWVGHMPDVPRLPGMVARLCATHANVHWALPPNADTLATWLAAGFKHMSTMTAPNDRVPLDGDVVYAPRWPVPVCVSQPAGRAVVIGAGLAGAAVALCLVRAGWQVCLIDQHTGPAQAASALPVGMLSAHVTARDTLMSELSRIGMPLHMRELVANVPQGRGWQPTQVTNLTGATTDDDAPADHIAAPLTLPAALVRPAALVLAWLNEARATGRLTTLWSTSVASLVCNTPDDGQAVWQVKDSAGLAVAQAPHVVVTAAYGSAALLAPHTPGMTPVGTLRAVKGQMTLAPLLAEPLAPHAMRQHGVFVPVYEDADQPLVSRIWAMGSTYERGLNNTEPTVAAHARNAASLAAMHAPAHQRLLEQAARGETVEWAQVRCASLDRLPLVGALPAWGTLAPSTSLASVPRVAGLWTVSALGSRGLTLAMLAAQLLVAQIQGGPLPVSKRHAAALDPARFALKQARKPASRQAVAH